MNQPKRFSNLPAYAFPRLRALLDAHPAGGPVRHMTIGEPKHPYPGFVDDIIAKNATLWNSYPPNEGSPDLLNAAEGWLMRRFGAKVDGASQIMALNGTREGLYNAMMALCPETKSGGQPLVLLPNPFYQVYMVAALSVGAQPMFLPATAQTGFLPDFNAVPADVLDRTAVVYICTPSNPQGAVADDTYLRDLIALAQKHDFYIFSDECYAEIYRDTPPPSALRVAQDMGADPERVVGFHSLSKRSNAPGLRSGFVVGGPKTIGNIRQLRAYAGAPLPGPIQAASAALWNDDAHVTENRALYAQKYAIADEIFADLPGYAPPQGGFFLWLPVPDGEQAALKAWCETGVRVLPGAYLSRDVNGENPGAGFIRVAMVAPKDEVTEGLQILRSCLWS